MSDETPRPAPRGWFYTWLMTGFAVLGVGAVCIVAGVLIFFVAGQWNGGRPPARVAAGGAAQQSYVVSRIEDVRGTPFEQIVISAGEGAGKVAYSSGAGRDDRNLILLDRRTGANRKLLPDNDHRIETRDLLPAAAMTESDSQDPQDLYVTDEADKPAEVPPAAYYLLVVRAPDAATADLVVGAIAGGPVKAVMHGLDGVDRYWMQDSTHLALICRERQQLYYRVVDMASLTVVTSRRIEID